MEIITNSRFNRAMKYLRALIIIFFSILLLCLAGILGLFIYAKILGPPPLAVPQSTLYFSNDGHLIGESNSGEKRYWVDIEDISPHIIHATVAIEDRKFYDHFGLDLKRIAGAVVADVKAMAKVQGASTITQQYARNLFLSHEKSWNRKLSEAFYAIRIEMNYTKEQILEGYLNTIYYGHGAYGVQAASQFYFGKDAKNLTLAEASMLAGIPKGPSLYSPVVSTEKAKQRQAIILQEMEELGKIHHEQLVAAKNEKLKIIGEYSQQQLSVAPYFQDVVKNLLKTKLNIDDRTIDLGGLRVYTTLNTKQQKIAEKAVQETISPDSEIQLGFVAMNPKNHYVTALVGGRDYEESPYNRAVQAIRQPGSTMKPILYYAALEKGFTPATTMRSEPTTFTFNKGKDQYQPHNFNNKYANDEVTMAQALAVSDNIYAVKTHLFLNEQTLVDTAKKFGITTDLKKVPSLALGTSGAKVIEMVNAYSLFANGGKASEPVFIKRVENYDGEVIYENKSTEEQQLKPDLTFVMSHMMTGMFDPKLSGYASVTGATISNQLTRPYAGKSGSTKADHWMIGFTPQLVSGIWTGYDNGSEITLTADKKYAKKIWAKFMEESLATKPIKKFKPPKGVKAVSINPTNGKLATPQCPVSRITYFSKGTEPTEYCTDHLDQPKKKQKPKKKKEEENEKNWLQRLLGR
ncbi:1A family penicillin-binding protein [Oikeobacillus pervagus]|uniref:1A family penicillin-binding protein n=1 Tax=Oikeobacillus pervagus TaxID=1325931 RepID=A0AAJ1WFP7_9BACI|nr:PBP1A family penicillin-binding protein [Oikeobacillus pervagus]MDQ0214187.1 1A family penicillin-binding protein [Oikeobacillus pervagus]